MVNLSTLLKRLEEFEGKLAVLYDSYAGRFTHDQDAADLFSKLGFEEMSHRDIIRYEGRVVMNDPSYFGEVDADLAVVEENIARVDAAIESRHLVTVEDALVFALAVEESSLEGMYKTVTKDADPAFGKIVMAMQAGCSDHVDAVKALINRRGIPVTG